LWRRLLFRILFWMKITWGSNSFSSSRSRNLDDHHGSVNFLVKFQYQKSSEKNHQKSKALHRAHTSELQLRLSLTKLIWASNSFLWEIQTFTSWLRLWNQKFNAVGFFLLYYDLSLALSLQMIKNMQIWLVLRFHGNLMQNQFKINVSLFVTRLELINQKFNGFYSTNPSKLRYICIYVYMYICIYKSIFKYLF
jgi:hypothetical protein